MFFGVILVSEMKGGSRLEICSAEFDTVIGMDGWITLGDEDFVVN